MIRGFVRFAMKIIIAFDCNTAACKVKHNHSLVAKQTA